MQIKRLLDIGAQTLFIPYVQSAAEAEQAVLAMRYPTAGVRGVSGLTRANRFGRVENYFARAQEELCESQDDRTARALADDLWESREALAFPTPEARARFLHNLAVFFGSPGPAANLSRSREAFSAALAHFANGAGKRERSRAHSRRAYRRRDV